MPLKTLKCCQCGRDYPAYRETSLYCSPKCRAAAGRARKREQRAELYFFNQDERALLSEVAAASPDAYRILSYQMKVSRFMARCTLWAMASVANPGIVPPFDVLEKVYRKG